MDISVLIMYDSNKEGGNKEHKIATLLMEMCERSRCAALGCAVGRPPPCLFASAGLLCRFAAHASLPTGKL